MRHENFLENLLNCVCMSRAFEKKVESRGKGEIERGALKIILYSVLVHQKILKISLCSTRGIEMGELEYVPMHA
jgi:hypothetical protein